MGEIKRQSVNNTLLSYAGAFLGFILIYLQPHLISANDIGLIRLMYSFSWMAGIVMPLGFTSITMRYFPSVRSDDSKHHGLFGILFLFTSAGALLVAGLLVLNRESFTNYFNSSADFTGYFNEALVFSYILSMISVYTVFANVLLKTTYAVFLTDVFTRVCQIALVVIYHYGWLEQNQFVGGYILIFVAQLVLLIVYLLKQNAVSFRVNWGFYRGLQIRGIALFGLIMMLTAFASLGVKLIDQLMIGHFLDERFVGIYATSIMICAVMEIPFNSLERIAGPKISYGWNRNDRGEVAKIYEMSSRYMFFAGSVLFCLLWSAADLIYRFLPGEYALGQVSFYVISLSSLINLTTGVNSSVIMYSNRYYLASIFLGVLIVVACAANYFLIPALGITGAAWGTVIALGTFNLLKYLYILGAFGMQPFSRHTLYILTALAISMTFIWFVGRRLPPFAAAAAGGLFTLAVFSFANVKFTIIEEVNKVFRRFGLLKALPKSG